MTLKNILDSFDIRQSPAWAKYMQSIGWKVKKVGNINLFIKKFPLLPFSMIKIQHQQGKINFEEIDQIAKRENALALIFEPHSKNFDQKLFQENGFSISKLLFAHSSTFKIDLTKSKETIWKSFSENARRNIKKAAQKNLNIIILENKKTDIKTKEVFYDLMHQLEKIKKIYTLPKKEFYQKAECFKEKSIFLFAYNQNQPVAALWLGIFKDTITYMHTGIGNEGYKLNANYLLVWEGIKYAKKQKINTWDFDAVFDDRYKKEHPRWKGFSEFKRKFGGEYIEYPPPQIKIYNPLFKILYTLATLI